MNGKNNSCVQQTDLSRSNQQFLDDAVHLESEPWVHMGGIDGAGVMFLLSHWCLMLSVTDAVWMQLSKGILKLGCSMRH